MTTSTIRLTIVLLALCLLLGVSFGSNGPAELQEATVAASSTGASAPEDVRGLQAWWENAVGQGEEDEDKRDNNDKDKDKDKDKDDNDNDNDDNCASRNDRSRECGANDNFPRRCCGSLVCDGTRCVREGDVEGEDENDEEEEPAKKCASSGERSQECGGGADVPEDCCGNMICNSDTSRCEAKQCSDLGERSQQCGGGGALPVTCCGSLVCNANNRCDEEGGGDDAVKEEDTSNAVSDTVSDTVSVGGDTSACAGDGERSIECGAANAARPASCCPGHVCSDDPGFAFRCKLDPSSTNGGSTDESTVPAPTPGATVVAPPPTKSPTFPAAAPPSDVGLLMTPTSEPTLEPTQEPTKDGELGFGSANGAAATATAFVGYTTLVLGALLAWTAIAQ